MIASIRPQFFLDRRIVVFSDCFVVIVTGVFAEYSEKSEEERDIQMKMLAVGIGILVVIAVFLTIFAFGLLTYVIKPKRVGIEDSIQHEKAKNFWGDFDSCEKEMCDIEAEDGYLLHGVLLKNSGKKYVIITHGYTNTRWGSVKYANLFYRLGYNVYIYDLRHHGANASCFCSMGYHESRDILAVTKYLRERFGEDIEIGLHGESLGAASSMLALGEDDRFAFCVENCGFADLGQLLEYLCKKLLHIPKKMSHLASVACKLRYGYRLDEILPVEAIQKNNKTPILFIHGKKDDFIPPEHCDRLYQASQAQKEIVYFEDAIHAQSYESDRDRYCVVVEEFLKKIGQIS